MNIVGAVSAHVPCHESHVPHRPDDMASGVIRSNTVATQSCTSVTNDGIWYQAQTNLPVVGGNPTISLSKRIPCGMSTGRNNSGKTRADAKGKFIPYLFR